MWVEEKRDGRDHVGNRKDVGSKPCSGSFRAYGADGFGWGTFPGLRYAPSGLFSSTPLGEIGI